jgi:hypothetical protein
VAGRRPEPTRVVPPALHRLGACHRRHKSPPRRPLKNIRQH